MNRIVLLCVALLAQALSTAALAQSSPNFSYGQVPTAGQWNAAFASKQDRLLFTPLNQAGGTMTGKLSTAPATVNGAGFSILPGIAPSSPLNGDFWITGSNLYVQLGGNSVSFATQSAVTAETTRATAAEQANASAISTEAARATAAEATKLAKSANLSDVTSISTARANLGAAASGANSDITSLSGLTTPLSGGQGGTGYTSVSASLDALFSSTQGAILYRGSSAWQGLPPGTAGQTLTTGGAGANPSWTTPSATAAMPPARQTVSTGPAAAGLPSFLPSTSGSLSLTAQNVSSSAPLVVTAAQGFGTTPNVSYSFTSNPTWSGLAASATNFLFVNASTGATGSTTLAPIYQNGGTPSTVSGQFTFDYSPGAMQGYLGNGTTAVPTPLVFVGEAVTSASAVTATVAYAYNGLYDSGFTTGLPAGNTIITESSNIGTPPGAPRTVEIVFQNVTAEFGFVPGDVITRPTAYQTASSISTGAAPILNRNTVRFVGAINGWVALTISAQTISTLTNANWAYKITDRRAF